VNPCRRCSRIAQSAFRDEFVGDGFLGGGDEPGDLDACADSEREAWVLGSEVVVAVAEGVADGVREGEEWAGDGGRSDRVAKVRELVDAAAERPADRVFGATRPARPAEPERIDAVDRVVADVGVGCAGLVDEWVDEPSRV